MLRIALLLSIIIVLNEASGAPFFLYDDDTWGIKDTIGFIVIFGYFMFKYIKDKFFKK